MKDIIFSPNSPAESVANSRERKPEAVVLGNGPSLRGFDFGRLLRFDVFGMNAAYRYWYEIGWFPHYYSCLDLVVGISHRDAIAGLISDSERLGIRAFLLRQNLIDDLGEKAASPKVFNFDLLRPGFDYWTPGPVTTGSHTCAWASLLGYRDIYLLGIDCNYVEVVSNAQLREGTILEIVGDAPNPNYFFDSYQKKGDKYNLPNPKKDLHLQGWRNVGEKISSRSRVFNANLASMVDAFPFVRFEDIEKGGRVPVYSSAAVLSDPPPAVPADYILIPCRETPESGSASLSGQSKPTGGELQHLPALLAYDGEWHSVETTEQLAFSQAAMLLPEVPGVLYFGFPWATLIDHLQENRPDSRRMQAILSCARPLLTERKHVITVCQHRDLLAYQNLFAEAGVTQVFWPYVDPGLDHLPEYEDIKVSPFPFTPALPLAGQASDQNGKRYLYSFVEPKTNGPDSSTTRAFILTQLSQDQRGLVLSRRQWDFEGITGGHGQMEAMARSNVPAALETWKILKASVFALCPSGPNGNSIGLWEAIAGGAIPVVFSKSSNLPGSNALWQEAIIFCPVESEDILSLPDQLAALALDEVLLERKRHALRQLWMLYGPDCFIYDILKLFISHTHRQGNSEGTPPSPSYARLLALAATIKEREGAQQTELDIFLLGCSTSVLTDPAGFVLRYNENADFRLAYQTAMKSCSRQFTEVMLRNLATRRISLG